jgi:hypothetical protein
VSETRPGEILLVPSRTRRRLLGTAGAATAVLAAVLVSAATAATLCAAAACLLGATVAFFLTLRPEPARRLRLHPDGAVRALSVSRMRIVFFAAQRRVVVWHDATDAATYRRVAVIARWQTRGQSR